MLVLFKKWLKETYTKDRVHAYRLSEVTRLHWKNSRCKNKMGLTYRRNGIDCNKKENRKRSRGERSWVIHPSTKCRHSGSGGQPYHEGEILHPMLPHRVLLPCFFLTVIPRWCRWGRRASDTRLFLPTHHKLGNGRSRALYSGYGLLSLTALWKR